ncbi:MAG TPA: tetratricopeptide repeat protein [Phycisphaerales bacterium]|nr:tetratricopeptide repeat protein [Phycisphaerales bacterium]
MNRPVPALCLLLLGAVLAPAACTHRARETYVPASDSGRSAARAERLTRQAAALADPQSPAAERLLLAALDADRFHGPAHNNLGVIYLAQGKLYEAAGEFEWARKLMPGHPDPRLNLGLVLERAGRVDQAIDSYQAALEVYPGHLPSVQALARAQVRHGLLDEQTPALLDEIALRSDASWQRWARAQRVRTSERVEEAR